MNDNLIPTHTVVDLDAWDRGPVFRHFIDDLRCVMSLTVDMEVSRFLGRLRSGGFSFYPAMIWAVSRVLNAHAEFRYGWDKRGRLVLWDRIEPYYAHFHPDRETFVKLVTPFDGRPGDLPPPLSGGPPAVCRPGPLRPDGRAAQHLRRVLPALGPVPQL